MRAKILQVTLAGGLFFIMSSGSVASYDAADLEKLFTDKSQRAQIDAMRSGSFSGVEQKQTRKIKVSGYVTRSDGKSVVWINNKNTLENTRIGDVRVHPSSVGNNKKVTISVDNKTTRLKPGETWYKETGKIVDDQ